MAIINIIDADLFIMNLSAINDKIIASQLNPVPGRPMVFKEDSYVKPGFRPLNKQDILKAASNSIVQIELPDNAEVKTKASKIANVVIDPNV